LSRKNLSPNANPVLKFAAVLVALNIRGDFMNIEMVEPSFMKTSVLFVCTDNTSRSPIAQAVFEKKVEQAGLTDLIQIDSAGTQSEYVGDKPNSRSQHAAAFRGYNLMGQTARLVTQDDFARFDMILVMDWLTMRALQNIAPEQYRHKIELVMRYAQNSDDAEIPDPFYLEQEAFNQAVDYMEDAALGLLDLVKRRLPQPVAA
jgi:protein-tyrosine phosphatase